jgi:hypothetical protein
VTFADESVCPMADNVWNEGKQFTCGQLDGILFHSEQYSLCVGICLRFVNSRQQLSGSVAICSQLVSSVVRHGEVYFKAVVLNLCQTPA